MLSLLAAVLPPLLAMPLRRARGARLAKTAHIGWLSIVQVADLEMADHARIGALAVVRATRLRMARRAKIRPLALLSTHTIELGEAVHVAPTAVVLGSTRESKSRLIVGDHSRIFPFCWLEPGEGITIGKHVGIGGHGLVFTHGAWSDYLDGGPMQYAPVVIEDDVWLPWRITVLAGVTIGSGSIVMSGSVVTRTVPPNVLAGGSPAKVIKERDAPAGADVRAKRANEIVGAFSEWHATEYGKPPSRSIAVDDDGQLASGDVLFAVNRSVDESDITRLRGRGISLIDHEHLTAYAASPDGFLDDFVAFLDRYGIRLYRR